MVVIVMGVSGSGKTTVGKRLAEVLGWRFVDADDVHPPGNIAKMTAGIPLTDEDRAPWLARLRDVVQRALESGESLMLACSALKRPYRELLTVDPRQVRWVYLHAPRELIAERLKQRRGHYMPSTLLDSQLAALEAPEDALSVDVSADPDAVVDTVLRGLGLQRPA
ncbi:gluconokinase [Vitiosangium sp. GDMCC 1.1324]|uniref:gluconokinase n=1 Tax=Vitiosangium sp. (strain GDMCC 1.1324) TaxID=2138576 RepID=UPI000D3A6833|nr:gluconokinase [Vitiosangium sp. GDMCC 1.1324]PTL79909.1 gluconate kinase [Vitiosangium sp. GDMCC 1.1324]